MHSSATDDLVKIFSQLGLGEFSLEKYLIIVMMIFVSLFVLPYIIARINGLDRIYAKHLGAQSAFGGFLVIGFFTAPIGVYLTARAFWRAFFPTES